MAYFQANRVLMGLEDQRMYADSVYPPAVDKQVGGWLMVAGMRIAGLGSCIEGQCNISALLATANAIDEPNLLQFETTSLTSLRINGQGVL